MEIREFSAKGMRLAHTIDGVEVGHVYLYVLRNDLHEAPLGLVEDLFVEPAHRGLKVGDALMRAVIEKAKQEKCYKLTATSRSDGTRAGVHSWYERLGFKNYGNEFRMDF